MTYFDTATGNLTLGNLLKGQDLKRCCFLEGRTLSGSAFGKSNPVLLPEKSDPVPAQPEMGSGSGVHPEQQLPGFSSLLTSPSDVEQNLKFCQGTSC